MTHSKQASKHKHFAVKATINNIPCLACRWKGAPLHIFEIIAAKPLRKELSLKDGGQVELVLNADTISLVTGWRKTLWRLFYQDREAGYYNDDLFNLWQKQPILRKIHKNICQSQF